MTRKLHVKLVEFGSRPEATIAEWEGIWTEADPQPSYVVDGVTWLTNSSALGTGLSEVKVIVRRLPDPYVLGIWNSEYDEPQVTEVFGEDIADARLDSAYEAVKAARASGLPLLYLTWPDDPAGPGISVAPGRITRITLVGPGVSIDREV